ncbi:hypothetical protein ACFLVJ_00365 [Chloroflexota bacterium]
MKQFLKLYQNAEKGQALPLVLMLLAIGSLVIVSSVNYATTSLKASQIFMEDTRGQYAASAGVDLVIWALGREQEPDEMISDNVNGLVVEMETVFEGTYTVHLDDLIEPEEGVHYDWLVLDHDVVSVGGSTADYTITIERAEEAVGVIRLIEVGVLLPQNYTYIAGSAALFPDNLTNDDPDEEGLTESGAEWLKWLWNPGQGPSITGNHTQGFQIDGSGGFGGSYCWAVAQSNDVGTIGEITGELYTINSVARSPDDGRSIVGIKAEVLEMAGEIFIFTWEITSY